MKEIAKAADVCIQVREIGMRDLFFLGPDATGVQAVHKVLGDVEQRR